MINTIRRFVQTAMTFLTNSFYGFLFTGRIYQGQLKAVCTPGLNCYSCPAAVVSCPIGALQFIMGGLRNSLKTAKIHIGLYVIGFLGSIAMLVGRFPCGWLCPFGFMQELIHKIPSKKFSFPPVLQYGKYVFLFGFVILLPFVVADEFGYGITWFCKYVCPAGTLEAGIPMIFLDPNLRRLVGVLYYHKLTILIALLIAMVYTRRPFCRTMCPLGGFYSFFNKISILRMRHDNDKCVKCEACFRTCPMHLKFFEGANQLNCIRCFRCYQNCKYGAIGIEWAGASKHSTAGAQDIANT